MPYSQERMPLEVSTPLGKDKLLLMGFTGHEAISQLFSYQLDLIAENNSDIAFDKLLGQQITVRVFLPDGKKRYFHGICSRFSQGTRDNTFTHYKMEVVPKLWLLTKKAQSRIFQQMSVPDILKKVLQGLDVSFEIQGTFHPRDFCVQYRETDFNFASRLMEEEGIFYFFKHSESGHKMVIANTSMSHSDVPHRSRITYDEIGGGLRDDDRVTSWEKSQELRSGKYTLWDHCFELPHKHLEAEATIQDAAPAGRVAHKFKLAGNDQLEIYDWPGEYAQRFDGVDRGGGDRPSDLQKIFQDNRRTVDLRIQEEAAFGLVIEAVSNCRQLTTGHKFTLERHFNADGQYVITSLYHAASQSDAYRSDSPTAAFQYSNNFTCIPAAVPFRPQRVTPKPVVQGTQTAVVVGPAGEEIFTDKYGRVKVQFHWDRDGRNDESSSCWVRVGTVWAGKQWGVIHIPRIAQEVVVDFMEGDPDQPVIIGSVYNAEQMPPYSLPAKKTQSGIKSRSSLGGTNENFNEFRFEDKKGEEEIYLHAEKDWKIKVEHDKTQEIDNDETTTIGNNLTLTVQNNRSATIAVDDSETVGSNQTISVGANQSITIGANQDSTVGGSQSTTVGASITIAAGAAISITAGAGTTITSGAPVTITAPMITLNAAMVQVAGVVQCATLITNSVVSATYTPGAGNIW